VNGVDESFLAPIIPFVTKNGKSIDLRDSLRRKGFLVHASQFPAVPRDSERVRIVIHEDNTETQMTALVSAIMEWSSHQMAMAKDASPSNVIRPRL
jgi:8-amino-7-oxononanoate synthase